MPDMDIPEELAPESEEEAKERQKELIQDAKEHKAELEAEQNEALEAIKQGSQYEEYETVQMGELEFEVKAWLPGDVSDEVERINRISNSGNEQEMYRAMQDMLPVLDRMSEDDRLNLEFWKAYYEDTGPLGMLEAVETVLGPAIENMEDKQEGVRSFQQE